LEGTSTAVPAGPPSAGSGSSTPKSHVLIGHIRDFMMGNGGSASSKELVAQFADVRGPDTIAEFRKMVKQIAEFKDSVWTLKEDYT